MRGKLGIALSLAVATLLSVAAPAAAQNRHDGDDWCGRWDDDASKICEEREVTIAANRPVIRVDGDQNGGVHAEGWDRDEIQITARVWAQARDDERAAEILREVRVLTDGEVIRADGPRTSRRENWGVSFKMKVPNRSNLELEAINGGVSVTNVEGDMTLRTQNGGVSLNGVAGNVRATTVNGGLHIDLDGDRWSGAGLDARTTNGGVHMSVPAGYNAELETATMNGGLEIDFPITVQGRIGGRQRTLTTTLGDGGPRVKAVTMNGGVTIRRS